MLSGALNFTSRIHILSSMSLSQRLSNISVDDKVPAGVFLCILKGFLFCFGRVSLFSRVVEVLCIISGHQTNSKDVI